MKESDVKQETLPRTVYGPGGLDTESDTQNVVEYSELTYEVHDTNRILVDEQTLYVDPDNHPDLQAPVETE